MARAGTGERRLVFRARLILECATGADNVQVAKRLGTTEQRVTLWRGLSYKQAWEVWRTRPAAGVQHAFSRRSRAES